MRAANTFPSGAAIGEFFSDDSVPQLNRLGKQYLLTDYGILSDGKIYTREIQALIEKASLEGGGVIVVPEGVFLTGALFFKQGVNLYIKKGGVLKGSDDISDYKLLPTRIEGESCLYFSALINADNVDGFNIAGEGIIDGNGEKAWKAFWTRLKWNPKATNKDEQRPRLVYISNGKNVTVSGVTLQNSHFWTNHIYKCEKVKYLNCKILAPKGLAPSSDALDIDVCSDVLVKGCYISVNDDAVVLKGGKGPYADTMAENGSNERVIVDSCEIGHAHSCLTCGSESVHDKDIIVKNIKVADGFNVLWLKMRPDTPQRYEYIEIDGVCGKVRNFLNINPWTQFFDLKGRKDIPPSFAEHVAMRNCKISCERFLNVLPCEEQYALSEFAIENSEIDCIERGDADGLDFIKLKEIKIKLLR